MHYRTVTARSILTPQRGGFLTGPPYPFTHTLAPYTGCAFGATTCGMFCYARYLPNWGVQARGADWGDLVVAKDNAPALLHTTLAHMRPERRHALRIFMSASTDPYQPLEARLALTRGCLQVFARFPDIDVLVVQTRAVLAARDYDLLAALPYAWLSVTVESDDPAVYRRLRGGPTPQSRLRLVSEAARAGVHTQVAVSPCLPYTPDFASRLAACGAERAIVDTFVDGDGSHGARTARSSYAAATDQDWRATDHARALYDRLLALGVHAEWSGAGFCGIPPRPAQ